MVRLPLASASQLLAYSLALARTTPCLTAPEDVAPKVRRTHSTTNLDKVHVVEMARHSPGIRSRKLADAAMASRSPASSVPALHQPHLLLSHLVLHHSRPVSRLEARILSTILVLVGVKS